MGYPIAKERKGKLEHDQDKGCSIIFTVPNQPDGNDKAGQ